MMIVDAIRSAPSEHAVYFLVTAYMESLRHFEESSGVPEPITRLPIAGRHDLHERLTLLRSSITTPLESIVPVPEVGAVLDSALERLTAFGGADSDPAPALLCAA
jgi:hypothetical protein